MKRLLVAGLVLIALGTLFSVQYLGASTRSEDELLCNTFSICAFDPATGETGVAVTTRLPEVGRLCPWAKAGVGAISTQALVVVKYGPQGLELLEKGMNPEQVLEELLKNDSDREQRQLGIIDAQGRTATHTGTSCIPYAGHRAGKNYTAQGNLLVGKETIDATADTFEATEGVGIELADRLIAALEAGYKAGGDKRKGQKQSAAVIVADPRRKHRDGSNISWNLQVAEHPEPVAELRRQFDTIRQKLGSRTFRLIEGRDILELKTKLHELGYYRKDATDDDFTTHIRDRSSLLYDVEAADAVDRFRKDHNLAVPSDGLGHGRGVVDDDFIRSLKAAYIEKRKQEKPKDQ